jgi:L-threonylcarbamoyladenylate synthase
VVAYPTETVYGFGALCTQEGVARVRTLKKREGGKPLIVLVESAGEVDRLAWSREARELAAAFWPGSLTLVLGDPERIFPPGVRSETGGVAVRQSPHPVVTMLLELLGAPLTSTSANLPDLRPALSGEDAAQAALALGGGPDVLILDAGTLPPSYPSTVIDCTGTRPVVLREGTVTLSRLRRVIPGIHGN